MKIKGFSYGVTVNLGNFESERFQVDIELTNNEPFEESVDTAKEIVGEQLKRLPLAIRERLDAALGNLSDAETRAETLERANQGALLQFNSTQEDITAKKAEFKQLLSQIALGNAELEALKADIREVREHSESLIQLGILVRDDAPKQMPGQFGSLSSREDNWDQYQEELGTDRYPGDE